MKIKKVNIWAITTILGDGSLKSTIEKRHGYTIEDYICAVTARAAVQDDFCKAPRPSHPANLGTASIRVGSLSMLWVLFISSFLM
jgi:hypothetical protein